MKYQEFINVVVDEIKKDKEVELYEVKNYTELNCRYDLMDDLDNYIKHCDNGFSKGYIKSIKIIYTGKIKHIDKTKDIK